MRDAERFWRLGEGIFPNRFEEDSLDYFDRHASELEEFRHRHSPWHFAIDKSVSAADLATPWPEADDIFSFYALTLLKDYGFDEGGVRNRRSNWSCSASIGPVKIVLDVDKGSYGVDYGAAWTITEFEQSWHIALPFFYSGGSFSASMAHPFLLQLDRFFSAYRLVMPMVWGAIEKSTLNGIQFLKGDL